MTPRIYVPGHQGLIGTAVLRRLAEGGICKPLTKTREELDLTDYRKVDDFFVVEKPDYVILAAGKVGGIIENQIFPADFITQNIAIQTNVIQAAYHHGVKRLIFFASSCMYPCECPQPMAEQALLTGIPEASSISYAIAKLAGMQMCLAYNQQFKEKKFIPVIPNSVYGPNDNFDPASSHVLSALIRRFHEAKSFGDDSVILWGSGSPRREFIHADDVADACFSLLFTDLEKLDLPMNIGSGHEYSIRELAEIIADIVEFNGRISWDETKPDGAPRKLLDSSRLHTIGWRPRIDFKQGIKMTYDWYCEQSPNFGSK